MKTKIITICTVLFFLLVFTHLVTALKLESPSLAKVYEHASENNGVVYDLDKYLNNHPFDYGFNSYHESANPTSVRDNSYALKASEFVQEKCNGCKETIIVGDDYVVPSFVRDISSYSGMWWWKSQLSTLMYSDNSYIESGKKSLSEIEKIFDKKQDVKIVISPELHAQLPEIDQLKNTIKSKYLADVEFIDEETVGCNSFSALDDSTLIIVGGEENNALRCYSGTMVETSQISLDKNIWDKDHDVVLLNPTPEIYDNLLALITIVNNGPDIEWSFSGAVVACLWDGKFEGTHPLAQEISCNMIPLVELAPDLRDSGKCLFGSDKDTVDGMAQDIVCTITHAATTYDLATWGAAIFTVGVTGVSGEVADVGIATLKVTVKAAAKNVAKKFGKDSVDTIVGVLKSPLIIKKIGVLLWEFGKSPGKSLTNTAEGLVAVCRHGRRVAENALDYIKEAKLFKESPAIIEHSGHFAKAADILGTKPVFLGNAKIERGIKVFDEETVDSFELVKEWGAFDDIDGLGIIESFDHDIGAIHYSLNGKKMLTIDDGMVKQGDKGLDATEFKQLIKDNVIFHEAGHDLVQKQYAKELPEWFDPKAGKFYFESTGEMLHPVAEILADLKAMEKLDSTKRAKYLQQQEVFLTRPLEKPLHEFSTFAEDGVTNFKKALSESNNDVGNIARVYYEADVNGLPLLKQQVNEILEGEKFKAFIKMEFGTDDAGALKVIQDIKSKSEIVARKFISLRQALEVGFPDASTMKNLLQDAENTLNANRVTRS